MTKTPGRFSSLRWFRSLLRWRSLPGTLIDRRGAALVPPILLAFGLNVAAVAGLAGIAGFHAVYASLTAIQWLWLCAVPAALAASATGYYFSYRSIYAAEGGYPLTIWASGAPLATAITGVAACRLLGGWLPLPPALASLPVLRETTQAGHAGGQALGRRTAL